MSLDRVADEGPANFTAVDGMLAEKPEGLDRVALVGHFYRENEETKSKH